MQKMLSLAIASSLLAAWSNHAQAWDHFLSNPYPYGQVLNLGAAPPPEKQMAVLANGDVHLVLFADSALTNTYDLRRFKIPASGTSRAKSILVSPDVNLNTADLGSSGTMLSVRVDEGPNSAVYPIELATILSHQLVALYFPDSGAVLARSAPVPAGGTVVLRTSSELVGGPRVTLIEQYRTDGSLVWSRPLSNHPAGQPAAEHASVVLDVTTSGTVRAAFIEARSGFPGSTNRDFGIVSVELDQAGTLLSTRLHDIEDGAEAMIWGDATDGTNLYFSYAVEGPSLDECGLARVPPSPHAISTPVSFISPSCDTAQRIAANSTGVAGVWSDFGNRYLIRFNSNGSLLYTVAPLSPAVTQWSGLAMLTDGTVVAGYPDIATASMLLASIDINGQETTLPSLPDYRLLGPGAGSGGLELQSTPDGGFIVAYDATDPIRGTLGVRVSKRFAN